MQRITVLFLMVVLGGCASGMKREVHNYEYQIRQKTQQINKAQTSLNGDPDVYVNGECRQPDRGPRPKPFCDDSASSEKRALVTCAAKYKGCDVALKVFGAELDTNKKRFLASEVCNRMVAEATGSRYTPADTAGNAISTYASDRCKNGGFFGKLFGCITAGTMEVMKFAEFQQCYNTEARRCYNSYLTWKNGPNERMGRCERNVALIAENKSEISDLEDRIYEKKKTWIWKMFGDD
jgi:hypothetical protein